MTLQAIDPDTGTFPENPLVGILYPEDGTGRGMGSINYSIRPLPGLPSGTVIENRAHIVFDLNDPIDTPLVRNTVDAAAPTSHVEPLPTSQTATTLTLNWGGSDDANGSGIAAYDIYVAVDSNPFALWLEQTTTTTATATVQPGHTYSFYSVATDNVGRREAAPAIAQTSIFILPLSWKNPANSSDVNNDGLVTPLDVLTIIGRLNSRNPRELQSPTASLHPAPYYDVNGDNIISPLDALLVIAVLRRTRVGNGEGEARIDSDVISLASPAPAIAPSHSAVIAHPKMSLELSTSRTEARPAVGQLGSIAAMGYRDARYWNLSSDGANELRSRTSPRDSVFEPIEPELIETLARVHLSRRSSPRI